MTAERFLDLFLSCGGDYYRRRDGRWALRGSRDLMNAVAAQITVIGRDALTAAMDAEDLRSSERLAELLPHRSASRPGSAA